MGYGTPQCGQQEAIRDMAAEQQLGMMNTIQKAPEETLGTKLDHLEKMIQLLDESIDQLGSKLSPILISEPPSQAAEGKGLSVSETPAMTKVSELADHVAHLHRVVQRLYRRVRL